MKSKNKILQQLVNNQHDIHLTRVTALPFDGNLIAGAKTVARRGLGTSKEDWQMYVGESILKLF
jgi:hypothetical protein